MLIKHWSGHHYSQWTNHLASFLSPPPLQSIQCIILTSHYCLFHPACLQLQMVNGSIYLSTYITAVLPGLKRGGSFYPIWSTAVVLWLNYLVSIKYVLHVMRWQQNDTRTLYQRGFISEVKAATHLQNGFVSGAADLWWLNRRTSGEGLPLMVTAFWYLLLSVLFM